MGRVQAALTGDVQQVARIVDVLGHIVRAQAMAVYLTPPAAIPPVQDRLFQPDKPLGVVNRWFFVEYCYILNTPHGLFFGIGKACWLVLFPVPAVPEQFSVALNERRGKRLDSRQHNGAVVLDDPLVLCPKLAKGQHAVPAAVGHAIRQITQNHVN